MTVFGLSALELLALGTIIDLGLWAAAFSVTPIVPRSRTIPLDVVFMLLAVLTAGFLVIGIVFIAANRLLGVLG